MNRTFKILTVLGLLIGLYLPLPSQNKPTIQVKFILGDSNYRDWQQNQFSNIPIEEKITERLISFLGEKFRFLTFQKAPQNYVLEIKLEKKEMRPTNVTSHLWEVGFYFKLSNINVPLQNPIYILFKPAEDYCLAPLPNNAERFIETIFAGLSDKFSETPKLTEELFNNILLADRAFRIPQRPNFILPIPYGSSGIGKRCELKLSLEIIDNGAARPDDFFANVGYNQTFQQCPPEYRHKKIIAFAREPNNNQLRISDFTNVRAVGIYLAKYIPDNSLTTTQDSSPRAYLERRNTK